MSKQVNDFRLISPRIFDLFSCTLGKNHTNDNYLLSYYLSITSLQSYNLKSSFSKRL